MANSKYAAFVALDPFFDIVMQGLAGAVDGNYYFEAVADDAVFEFRYPAIPIGPHWMILWPFDAKAAGLPTVMRDAGTLVMFAGTP
jgi:hypothetical protein